MKTSSGKDERRLYGDLAWTWPIISPVGNYIEETELFSKLIKEHSKIDVKTLLHLGCGGGHNDYTFKKYFKVTSLDISEDMLSLAKKLNPEINYKYSDMRTIRLKKNSMQSLFLILSILSGLLRISKEHLLCLA